MKKKSFNCPAELTISLVGGKWKMILIYNLRKGAQRFGQLKRLSPGITSASLTKQLRELENAGLVMRSEFDDGALPAVEYQLTDRGQSLRPLLNTMIRWGLAHQKDYVMGDFRMDTSFRT